uniref:Uncharacterized protein n=1 Tax=Electrophorus electricus TaxID=8005 RepID=A0AAY5EDB2_ELEEL
MSHGTIVIIAILIICLTKVKLVSLLTEMGGCSSKMQFCCSHRRSSKKKTKILLDRNTQKAMSRLQQELPDRVDTKEIRKRHCVKIGKFEEECSGKELEEKQKETKNEQSERWHLKSEREDLESERQHLKGERENLESERQHRKSEREALESERQHLKSEREALERERQHLKGERENLESERQHRKSEREALESERQHLKSERETLERERQYLKSEREALESERQHLKSEREPSAYRLRGLQWSIAGTVRIQSFSTHPKHLSASERVKHVVPVQLCSTALFNIVKQLLAITFLIPPAHTLEHMFQFLS